MIDELKLKTANELLDKNIPKTEWIIEDLLPAGLTVLSSRPKVGKSFLAFQIAKNVKSDEYFFNKYKTCPGNSLFLSFEDSELRLQQRLKKMNGNINFTANGFELYIETDFGELDANNLGLLSYFISEYKLKFIVIDTLAKAVRFPDTRGNAYYEEYRIMGELQKFALQYGVGLMLIHHNRKQGSLYSVDSILGTSGISGGADTLWIMNKIGEQIRLDIFGKDVDSKTLWLKFEKANFKWQLLSDLAE